MKLNENNSIDIITTIQSTKMTDQYRFSQFQTNLYIINKENDEIICIINEVNNLLTVLSLIKCLISTININDTMYRVDELERMYVDKSKSVFCKIEVGKGDKKNGFSKSNTKTFKQNGFISESQELLITIKNKNLTIHRKSLFKLCQITVATT